MTSSGGRCLSETVPVSHRDRIASPVLVLKTQFGTVKSVSRVSERLSQDYDVGPYLMSSAGCCNQARLAQRPLRSHGDARIYDKQPAIRVMTQFI
jgi:hypothetical protein